MASPTRQGGAEGEDGDSGDRLAVEAEETGIPRIKMLPPPKPFQAQFLVLAPIQPSRAQWAYRKKTAVTLLCTNRASEPGRDS